MNIIAVHRDKVSLLESKFEKRCVWTNTRPATKKPAP
jgi:hypothetical protein